MKKISLFGFLLFSMIAAGTAAAGVSGMQYKVLRVTPSGAIGGVDCFVFDDEENHFYSDSGLDGSWTEGEKGPSWQVEAMNGDDEYRLGGISVGALIVGVEVSIDALSYGALVGYSNEEVLCKEYVPDDDEEPAAP